jgi:hypothetical protein
MVRTPGSVTNPAKQLSQKQPVQEGIVRGEDGDADDDVGEDAEDDFAEECHSLDIGGAADASRLDGSTSVGDFMATTDSAMGLLISTEVAAVAEQMRATAGVW